MFDFLQKSLRLKLLISFISISILPFIFLLTYSIFLGETKIINKIISEQINRTKEVVNLIESHLQAMEKEVNFLSSLDMMDDILVEDIDKRISILLAKKVYDLDLILEMYALDTNAKVISSSSLQQLTKQFDYIEHHHSKSGNYIIKDYLYIYSTIYSSFNKSNKIGYLVLKYKLENLEKYLTYQAGMHSYIVDKKASLKIGDYVNIDLQFMNTEESVIDNEHVIVYKNLSPMLKDFYIVYAVNKEIALETLYDFTNFMLYISVLILLIIIYISFHFSKDIVRPIENLTQATNKIIKERDYSSKLDVHSLDEIATLTHSFNKMLSTTSFALENLEKENKLRLKRFIQLIEIFNTIIQTKDEQECIETSIREIKKLTKKDDLYFQKEKKENSIDIYVTNFEKNTKEYFISISLSIEEMEDENERNFYDSIATMTTLQLERIRLIDRTISASNAKSAFISTLSHELRTPLNAIIGNSQSLLVYEQLSDDQLDTVGSIESSAQYLLSMINEILDIAKIEVGKMEVYLEDINLIDTVLDCYSMLKLLADEKELNFTYCTENLNITYVHTDPKIFKQIVLNLLSNSIKFTEEGYIKLDVYNDEQNIYVRIQDSGIGISQEDISELFTDFTQVDNIMQKQHKGTGLGLSLSKKLSHLINGDVYLSSDGIGKGTTSIFSLKI